MKKLYIDFNNLSIRCLFANTKVDHVSENFQFHKHLVFNTIFSNIKKFEPDEVILAVDSQKNWRKKVYSEYKANRKLARDASDFDWPTYFTYISEYIDELKTMPFKILQVSFAEADDIIGVLSKHSSADINIVVTADKDYIQLLQHKHIQLFDPIKKKFIIDKDPLRTLKIKVIMGDKGDNVPAIKPRTGEKTAIKILDTNLEELLQDEKIKENYNRNEILVSFDKIPVVLQKVILKQYEECIIDDAPVDYFKWMVKHRLREISERASHIIPVLNQLRLNNSEGGGSLNALF